MIFIQFRLLVALLLLIITQHSYAFEASNSNGKITLDEHLWFYEDVNGSLSYNDVNELAAQGKLTKNRNGILNFGFTKSTIWIHTSISFADSVSDYKSWMLSIDYSPLEKIDLYVTQNGQTQQISSGTSLPFESRPLEYRNFVYPLVNDGEGPYEILLRVESSTSLQVPISLWADQSFFEYETFSSYGWGIFFGILIALSLYNLFLYMSVRDPAYLYYVLYLTGLSGVVLFLNGQGFQFIWSGTESWNKYALLMSTCFAVFWALQFSRAFLGTKKYIPNFDRFLLFAMSFAALSALAGLYGLDVSLPKLSGWVAGVFVVSLVITAAKSYLIGHPMAPYFGLAWSLFLAGILVYLASVFGIAPTNFLTENAVQFGSATEAILLSLGLAQRIKLERRKRYEALQSEHETILKLQQAERKLMERASFDSLTMLPNSTLLYKCIEDFKAANAPQTKAFGLVLIRFKRFHEVSKTLGKNQADRLMIRAADRIAHQAGRLDHVIPICRSKDYFHFLSMIDSTSFAVVVNQSSDPGAPYLVAESLLESLNKPIDHEGMLIDINSIIGIASFPTHGHTLEELIKHASIALDHSSRSSQAISTYSPEQNYYSTRRLSLMGDLLKAIESNELSLYLQPQVDLQTNRVVGAEALIRWNHETHGFVPPDEFIPLAEQSGLIRPLTAWVFDKALEMDEQLQSRGYDIRLSLNISVKNIVESGFAKSKIERLNESGVLPERIVFEMTESIMIEDIDNALSVLNELNRSGIKLSIDDFGTGHSSLSYLTQLPVHELKIDRSFVSSMLDGPQNQKIVEMTINLAHTLGLHVVAEGIEDEQTMSKLKSLKCDIAQGYFVSKPMNYEAFVDWLASNQNYKPISSIIRSVS